jgi:hypothetical protein
VGGQLTVPVNRKIIFVLNLAAFFPSQKQSSLHEAFLKQAIPLISIFIN